MPRSAARRRTWTLLLPLLVMGLALIALLALWLGDRPGLERSERGQSGQGPVAVAPGGSRGGATGKLGPEVAEGRGPGAWPGGAAAGEPERGSGARIVLLGSDPAPGSASPTPETIDWGGRVLEEHTQLPLEGVEVRLEGAGRSARALTDERGRFGLRWYAGLGAGLVLTHEGYVDQRSPDVTLEERGEFRLSPSAVLRGWVEGVDEPEAARVLTWHLAASGQRFWRSLEAPLDGEGLFEMRDLEPGEYIVTALIPGRSVGLEAGVQLEAGVVTTVGLSSTGGSRLAGRLVIAGSRAPVEGALLRVKPRIDNLPKLLSETRTAEIQSAVDGSFGLEGLAPGEYSLKIATTWGGELKQSFDVPTSESTVELEVEVPGPATLSGSVIDSSGHGAGGARVWAFAAKDKARIRALGSASYPAGTAGAECDDAGNFAIQDLPAGAPLLVVAYPLSRAGEGAGLPGHAEQAALEPGQLAAGLRIELPRAVELRGRVRDADGTALTGARLHAEYPFAKTAFQLGGALSDERGEYALGPLLVGRAAVVAELEGYIPEQRVLDILEGDNPELDFELRPARTVTGVALDESGFGIPNLPIRFEVDPQAGPEEELGKRSSRFLTHTDAFGRFSFGNLRDLPWVVSGGSYLWEQIESDPRVVVPPADTHVVLTFVRRARPERAALTGEVHLAEGGIPSGLQINGLKGGLLEIDGGRFSATGLVPTRLDLTISADGHAPCRRKRVQLLAGETLDLGLIELLPATRFTVVVRDGKGRGVEDARVILEPLPEPAGGLGGRSGRLALAELGEGRYRIEHAPHAMWVLVVRHPEHKKYAQNVHIQEREQQKKNLVLD